MLKKYPSAKSTTFYFNESIITIDTGLIRRLKDSSRKDKLGRARVCLHSGPDAAVQEMIIAMDRKTYVRPHRHHTKTESTHIIEGELLIILFDDTGKPVRRISLRAGKTGQPFACRIPQMTWHTQIPQTQTAVIHEIISGPFSSGSSDFATWAPEEGDTEASDRYIRKINRIARR